MRRNRNRRRPTSATRSIHHGSVHHARRVSCWPSRGRPRPPPRCGHPGSERKRALRDRVEHRRRSFARGETTRTPLASRDRVFGADREARGRVRVPAHSPGRRWTWRRQPPRLSIPRVASRTFPWTRGRWGGGALWRCSAPSSRASRPSSSRLASRRTWRTCTSSASGRPGRRASRSSARASCFCSSSPRFPRASWRRPRTGTSSPTSTRCTARARPCCRCRTFSSPSVSPTRSRRRLKQRAPAPGRTNRVSRRRSLCSCSRRSRGSGRTVRARPSTPRARCGSWRRRRTRAPSRPTPSPRKPGPCTSRPSPSGPSRCDS